MALYRLSINSEYFGFEGHEGKNDSGKEGKSGTVISLALEKYFLGTLFHHLARTKILNDSKLCRTKFLTG